jgi:hypothetical protein
VTRDLLKVAVGIEVLTGLALIFDPSLVTRMLFAGELSTAGLALAPLAGFGLLALCIACWPGARTADLTPAFRAMLTFSALSALYLVYHVVRGGSAGFLLWPAAVTHAALATALVWVRRNKNEAAH